MVNCIPKRGKEVATHLYGQEINAETYAICKACRRARRRCPVCRR